jgi:hypothetical protein
MEAWQKHGRRVLCPPQALDLPAAMGTVDAGMSNVANWMSKIRLSLCVAVAVAVSEI